MSGLKETNPSGEVEGKVLTVRKIGFHTEEDTMPAMLEDDLAVWSSELRGGMMTGNIKKDGMIAQKIKVADGHDYFVHFCRAGKMHYDWLQDKDTIFNTVTGLATQVAYMVRWRGQERFDDLYVQHDEAQGSTWLTIQGGYHSEGGFYVPTAPVITREDGHPSGVWSNTSFSQHIFPKTKDGIDWGVEEYGRTYTSGENECGAVCIEIPWKGSPAHVRRKVRAMLDSVKRQIDDLAELIQMRSKKDFLPNILKRHEDDLDLLLKVLEEQLSTFESKLFEESDKSNLVGLADEILKELDVLEKARADRSSKFISEMPSETLLTFRLMENTDVTLKNPSYGFESIKRAWLGDRDHIWDEKESCSDDTTKKINKVIHEKGELCFDSTTAKLLTGNLYNNCHESKRRVVLVELVAGDEGLQSDEEVMLLYLRSIIYEDIEVKRADKLLKKTMDYQALQLRGDEEEVEQLMKIAKTSNTDSDLKVRLQHLQRKLEAEINRLESDKETPFDWAQIYGKEDFRPAVAALKTTQGNHFKELQKLKKNLKSQLKECQEELLKTEDTKKLIDEAKREVSNSLYQKGFSLHQLLNFVHEKCLEGKLKDHHTTAEVVFNIAIPESAEKGCCYADVFPGGPKKPQTLMSHWWGNKFIKLVEAICEHASGTTDLDPTAHVETNLEKTYWLCIFGVNQHLALCHGIPEPCRRPKFEIGNIKCQMDKFDQVMQSIPNHGLALDFKLTTIKRVWVLLEIAGAIENNKNTGYNGSVESQILRLDPKIPSVKDAEASYEADKTMIVDAIKEGVGIEKFDENVFRAVKSKISILHAFLSAESGNLGGLKEELGSYREVINETRNTGTGETLLQISCKNGHIDLVRFLLEQPEIDVNQQSRFRGWTALHFVAHHCTPEDEEIVNLLIKAGADPEVKHELGRTPLEEALCGLGTSGKLAKKLKEVTKTEPSPYYMNLKLSSMSDLVKMFREPQDVFSPLPCDEFLFRHDNLRMCNGGSIQLLETGCLHVTTSWVQPISFGGNIPKDGVPHDCNKNVSIFFMGAVRLKAYVNYRYPSWTFDKMGCGYCGAYYVFDLDSERFKIMRGGEFKAEFGENAKIPISFTDSVAFFYP